MTLSSRRILRIYKSLDAEQIRLVIEEKIEGKHDLQHWLKKLHKLAVMDTLGDDVREKSRDLLIVFGIFTVFTIFLTVSKPFLFFFPIGFFLLLFYFLIMYFTLNKIDIGNNLRIFIVPLLESFNKENMIEDPFYMKMDFSNPKKNKNLVVQADRGEDKGKIYKHHWMEGSLTYTDQVMIRWQIVDIVKETAKKQAGNAARMGFKKNYLIIHQLAMDFHIPKNTYEIIIKNEDLVESEDYYILRLKREDTSKSLEEGMNPGVFLDAVQEGYTNIKKKKEAGS